jgi:membrane-associated two-gene conflict system component 1 (EACC1)
VRLEIRVVDEDETPELRDFYRWLRDDEAGPDQIRLETRTGTVTGAMGGLEVIDLVLTQSVAVANLAMVYATWRRSRGRRPSAGFTFTRLSDGLSVTVEDGSDESVRRLLAVLATPPGPETGNGPPPRR